MNIEMKGIVQSEPRAADDKRITFVLFCEDTKRNISCMSSLRFDALTIKRGDEVTLVGWWANDLSTGQAGCFVFDADLGNDQTLMNVTGDKQNFARGFLVCGFPDSNPLHSDGFPKGGAEGSRQR